jgi:hypothetical protein
MDWIHFEGSPTHGHWDNEYQILVYTSIVTSTPGGRRRTTKWSDLCNRDLSEIWFQVLFLYQIEDEASKSAFPLRYRQTDKLNV